VSQPSTSAPTVGRLRDTLERDGYALARNAVAPEQVEAAVRRLNIAIRWEGLSAEQVDEWSAGTFFPHLRWEPEVWAVLPAIAGDVFSKDDGDSWADPQLLMRFPDEDQPWPLEPHVDRLPEWAQGRTYRGIVGVALTAADPRDGAPYVWPGSHRGIPSAPIGLTLAPGDALFMHPQLGHSGGLNLGATIRTAIYFRLLTNL
jgi:ectoine hydroxylase-related dioxygenase (phytanoyl-CoA dioxygenase family)